MANAEAAYYTGNRRVEIRPAEVVPPAPGMVQLEVAFTGICGTDLHIVHGAMDSRVGLPAILGHEMAGRVAAPGEGVTDWHVGDPVTVMPLRSDATAASQPGPGCVGKARGEHPRGHSETWLYRPSLAPLTHQGRTPNFRPVSV